MAMKGYGASKTRNMEKSPASNARPSQGNMSVSGGSGAKSRGTENKNQFKFGKVNKG